MRKSIRAFIRSIRGRSTKPDPIQWTFTVQKTIADTYMVYVTALMDYPWRLYFKQSAQEGPLPAQVEFEENASVRLLGEPEEMGIFKEEFDTKLNVLTRYCTSGASFVQEIKADIRPAQVKGKVIFMACTEKKCMDATEIEFQVELD